MKHRKKKLLSADTIISIILLTLLGTTLILVPIFTKDSIGYPFDYIFAALGGFAYGTIMLLIFVPFLHHGWEKYYGFVVRHRKDLCNRGFVLIQVEEIEDGEEDS